MSFSVGIHPPKTPITETSHGVAQNTIPNVCKMPGPPAPFVPAPLPNIGKSELSPKDYSKTVKIEGHAVAIRGATFESIGDMASKGTGGGLISANTHGPTKFITPGSMTVKIEGKNVHLLGEPMLNNCGPSGSPPNTGATMAGVKNPDADEAKCPPHDIECEDLTPEGEEKRKQRMEADKKGDQQRINKHTYDFDKAVEAGNTAKANEALRLGVIAEGQLKDKEFEQQVAKEAKAKYTGVKYKCKKNCGFEGEIDVITEKGVIKECKRPGTSRRSQIEKYKIVGPAILGAAFSGIHVAIPSAKIASAKESISDQGLGNDCGIQPH